MRDREISNDEGHRLLQMVRRSSGSIVTWSRARIVLWSAGQSRRDRSRAGHRFGLGVDFAVAIDAGESLGFDVA